ncbi:MAG: hypothetical protein EPO65_09680, partial [Dehalococcoidia bacterium]
MGADGDVGRRWHRGRSGRVGWQSWQRRTPMSTPQADPIQTVVNARTIAVVGASSNPRRASNDVAKYLIEAGYTVYLVNPTETEILGRPVYATVRDLPETVDIVDIFRRSEDVPPVVEDAIAAGGR